jgi:hypothetical protein
VARLIGIDPGALMSGLAVRKAGKFVFWLETDDPCVLWEVIFDIAVLHRDTEVILEDFLGSGRRDNAIKRTIEVLGYVYYSCIAHGVPVELVEPQKRLAYVSLVPAYIHGKDERAAAAHVLAAEERRKSVPHLQGDSLLGGTPAE